MRTLMCLQHLLLLCNEWERWVYVTFMHFIRIHSTNQLAAFEQFGLNFSVYFGVVRHTSFCSSHRWDQKCKAFKGEDEIGHSSRSGQIHIYIFIIELWPNSLANLFVSCCASESEILLQAKGASAVQTSVMKLNFFLLVFGWCAELYL